VIYHKFAQNITYTVTLTVTDSNGLQSSKAYSMKVENRLVADINNDGKVDGKDLAIAAKAYGTIPGSPLWDPRADVNLDGRVDGKDIAIISKNFGQLG
jgi:predicted secreted protein